MSLTRIRRLAITLTVSLTMLGGSAILSYGSSSATPSSFSSSSQLVLDLSDDEIECIARSDLVAGQYTWEKLLSTDDCEEGGLPNTCCEYWDVTISWSITGPSVSCTTGGEFQCESDENCGEREPK